MSLVTRQVKVGGILATVQVTEEEARLIDERAAAKVAARSAPEAVEAPVEDSSTSGISGVPDVDAPDPAPRTRKRKGK